MYTGLVGERVSEIGSSGRAKSGLPMSNQLLDAVAQVNARVPGSSKAESESFATLLGWLDSDADLAAQKYEEIRRKLITHFNYRRCCIFAEDLADETFDRVARKLPLILETYKGSPVAYFMGVARRVYLEYLRSMSARTSVCLPQLPARRDEGVEPFAQLDACLGRISTHDRELLLSYYRHDGRAKIHNRRMLARELGINRNALRIRVHRIVCRLRQLSSEVAEGV